MLDRLITFLRNEAVLCIAFVCACASMVLVGDVSQVPDYIDWRVIVLLFCLMAAVAGLRESGVMARIAKALVMLPFFALPSPKRILLIGRHWASLSESPRRRQRGRAVVLFSKGGPDIFNYNTGIRI